MTATNAIKVQSSFDGPQLTVSDILKDPTTVPQRVLDLADAMFIAEQVLRKGPPATSGVVKFRESTPLFTDDPTQIVAELGEYPEIGSSLGIPRVVSTVKRGAVLRFSDELKRRNDVDLLNTRMTQASNQFALDWDGFFFASLLAKVVSGNILAASVPWENTGAKTRSDITQARKLIDTATLPGTTNQHMGFRADTLLLNQSDVADMVGNDDTWKAWVGNMADQSVAITGKLPAQLFGLDVWQSYSVPAGTGIVCQRGIVGFVSDEVPLEGTPLDFHAKNDSYSTRFRRQSAVGIDQPLAIATITGIA